MSKTCTALPYARITENAGARLRQPTLVRRRRLSRIPSDELDVALPAAEDLTAQMSRLADLGREARDGR